MIYVDNMIYVDDMICYICWWYVIYVDDDGIWHMVCDIYIYDIYIYIYIYIYI